MGGEHNPAWAYHTYLGPAMFVPMSRVMLSAAKPRPGERALEVACGTGILTSQLPPLVGGAGRVVGLDINPGMLAVAAAQPAPDGPPIQWVEGNGMKMDVPSGSFDLVLCQHGLQFFPDRAAGAREMRRVLGSGGRAVVACWQGIDKQTFVGTLIRAEARHLGITEAQAGMPFMFGDPGALRDVLVAGGFSRVEVETHVIEARFSQPETFLRMTLGATVAVMPETFANVDLEGLIAKVTAECAGDLARYRDGDYLRFPMPTNVAIAYA